jgi:hypothetical protein
VAVAVVAAVIIQIRTVTRTITTPTPTPTTVVVTVGDRMIAVAAEEHLIDCWNVTINEMTIAGGQMKDAAAGVRPEEMK